jgi:hypothetical protein
MDEPDRMPHPDQNESGGAPATGERSDHHNSVPGVAVPGSSGTDPAGPVPGKPGDEEEPGAGREDEGGSPV